MEKEIAIQKLQNLIGVDLFTLTSQFKIQHQFGNNKGWAGQTLEKYLGLNPNSRQSPDFTNWELKSIPVFSPVINNKKFLVVQETMAITMIGNDVAIKPFNESHLYDKIKNIVCVVRSKRKGFLNEIVEMVFPFKLSNKELGEIEKDYNLIQSVIVNKGFSSLRGEVGKVIQPRTKGSGYGSSSRAFYFRKNFLQSLVDNAWNNSNCS
jgi:DNA mismatch repair protein MutH